MKIQNESHYDTHDLRRIIAAVALIELDPSQRKRLRIRIIHRRSRRWNKGCSNVSGRASIGGSWMRLSIGEGCNAQWFAWLTAHEMAHIRGLRHRSMSKRYDWEGVNEFEWAKDMPLGPRQENRKQVVDVTAKRHAAAIASLKRWETKAKRAATGVKKARRKVAYYEKRMAASPSKGSGS